MRACQEIGFYSESPISFYKSPAFDAVLEKARATLNDKKRGEFIKQAFRILHDDVASILLWNKVTVFAMISFTPTVIRRGCRFSAAERYKTGKIEHKQRDERGSRMPRLIIT